MKKLLIFLALVTTAVAMAVPAQVTITKAEKEGHYILEYGDTKRFEFGLEAIKNYCVKLDSFENAADFMQAVILFEEGIQHLTIVTPEQKQLIEEADLNLEDKKSLLVVADEEAEEVATVKICSFIELCKQIDEANAANYEDTSAEEAPAVHPEVVVEEAEKDDSDDTVNA